MTDKDLEARLKFKTDQQSANQAKDAVGGSRKRQKTPPKLPRNWQKRRRKPLTSSGR